MSLDFPHVHRGSQYSNVSSNNFSTLLNATSRVDIVTPVSLQAFDEFKNAQIGYGHHLKKFAASALAYGSIIGIPTVAVGGATYYLFKDFFNVESLSPKLVYEAFESFKQNDSFFKNSSFIPESVGLYFTPKILIGSLATIAAIDRVMNAQINFSPIKSVAKWTVGMVSSAWIYAAWKAGDIASRSYELVENEKIETRKRSHETIFNELKCTYDDIADGFVEQFQEAQKSSPKVMLELMEAATELHKLIPYFISQLTSFKMLTSSEIALIMDKLTSAVQLKNVNFNLRSPKSEDDHRYNAELLSILPDSKMETQITSDKAKKHIASVKSNSLGALHTIKSYVASGAAFALTSTIGIVATSIITGSLNSSFSNLDAGFITLASLPSVVVGGFAGKYILDPYKSERVQRDLIKEKNSELAYQELLAIYDGMASYFDSKKIEFGKRVKDAEKFRVEAEEIFAKMPIIKAELSQTGIVADPTSITANLEVVLEKILR